MRAVRRTSVLLAGALVAFGAALLPAQGAAEPTTLVVEGTVRAVVVDQFGVDPASRRIETIVTDDGAEIPVDLADDAAANGRFVGELVVDGDVKAALARRGLLPRPGSTIAADTRTGRVAVAAAENQEQPLRAAESVVTPVSAAAVTRPEGHRAYVAVMEGRGSVEESDSEVAAVVDGFMSYWKAESGGAISSFTRPQAVERFTQTVAGPLDTSCGMATDPEAVWNQAQLEFPGVPFTAGSGNHLLVAMADECGDAGVVGVALVGSDFSSEGPMSFALGETAPQVGVHELGHTFGLGHANLDTCPNPDLCGDGEYFDLFSPMALAVSGSAFTPPALDSAFRARLGVASTSEVATMTASGTVTLRPRSDTEGVRGIRVVDPVTSVRYFIELRSGTARDSGTFYESNDLLGIPVTYDPGIAVTTISADGALTLLTRKASMPYAGAFTGGQTFTSPGGGTHVAVGALSSAGTPVTVTLTPPSAAPPGPLALLQLSAKTPHISGVARVGRTLKARVGSWSPRPGFGYQWFANGKRIGAKGTKSSFKLTSKQKGKRITVRITGSKAGYATVAKTSKKTTRVAAR